MFKSRSDEPTWQTIVYPLCLTLIVISGALLRFSHANWDSGYTLHPDERGILFVAQTIAAPDRAAALFSPRYSSLNPMRNPDGTVRPYAYGHLPLYVMVAAQRLLSLPCEALSETCQNIAPDTFIGRLLNVNQAPPFGHLIYVGRALSALYSTLTILITALLATRLFNKAAGLLAAAMMAFAVLHIQNAHFGTVDTALALFSTLSVLLLAVYARNKRRITSILAGCAIGLAIGCKASGIVLLVPLVAAHLERAEGRRIPVRLADHTTFWLSMVGAGAAFALTSPYAVLDPVPYLSEIATQGGMTAGKFDWPFTRQFIGTAPFFYMIGQQARWTLGLPLTLAGYAGLIWADRALRSSPDRPRAITFVAAVTLLLVTGIQFAKFPRYTLPLTPLLATFGAGMLCGIPFQKPQYKRLSILVGWLFVVVPTILYAIAFVRMYDQEHPWVTASEWIYETLPYGSTIVVERWDDPLPLDMNTGERLIREELYDTALVDPFAEPDDQEKLGNLLREVASADTIILSSNRLYGTIPRLEDRYPLTSRYYQALFGGELGYELTSTFSREPNLFGISLYDDPFRRAGLPNPLVHGPRIGRLPGPADESFTVYDHPRVLVFQNTARLSADEMRAIILAWPAAP